MYIPNGHKISTMSVQDFPNCHTMYQHFPIQGPPKFTQIGIFGLEINHPATVVDLPCLESKRRPWTEVRLSGTRHSGEGSGTCSGSDPATI
jgi:hypothetical protein